MDIKKIYFEFADVLSKLGYKVEVLRLSPIKSAKYLIFYNFKEPIVFVLESSETFSLNEYISNPYDLYFHLGYLNDAKKVMYFTFFGYSRDVINEFIRFINDNKKRFELLKSPFNTLQEWKKEENLIYVT